MQVRVKVKNPMWKFRHTYASYMRPHIKEFEVYEGELKKAKKDWRTPKNEFLLVNGSTTHILNQEDVINAWVKR